MRTLKTLLGGVAFAATLAASSAQAQTTLLDLVNPAGQTNTPYVLSFMATSNVTTLTFAGYQVPSSETATGIGLYLADAGPICLARPGHSRPPHPARSPINIMITLAPEPTRLSSRA